MTRDVNENIFEIRYKPNSKVLDNRGVWAERISQHMGLSEWQVVENRIDVLNKENTLHAFVGYRNAGVSSKNAPSKSAFCEQATKFVDLLCSFDGFEKTPFVERLGVRSRFCHPSDKSFEELKNAYSEKYLRLTEEAKKALKADLVDVGGALNFKDQLGNFNTLSGPMEKKQILQYFQGWKDIPDVGLYYDIDYWIKPEQNMKDSEVSTKLRLFSSASWDKFDAVKRLVLEG